MKGTEFIRREAINWILLAMPFIYMLLVYDRLPQFAPFPLTWEQGVYYAVFFTMGVSLFWYLVFLVKPAIVPKTTIHQNLRMYHRIRTLILCYTSLISMIFISEGTGMAFNWPKIGILLAWAFVMTFGNLYPTIRQNHMIGIKNAWTLSNEQIWNRTHRFSGRVAFAGGLLGALYAILFDPFPVPYMPVIYVGYVFLMLGISHFYSYRLYRKLQRKSHF